MVPRAQRRDGLAADRDVELTFDDEIEAVAHVTLARDLGAGHGRHAHEVPRKMLESRRRQRREQRQAAEEPELMLRYNRPLVDPPQSGPGDERQNR